MYIFVLCVDLLLCWLISLNYIDYEINICCIIYWVEGEGISVFFIFFVGDYLDVMGFLGNGFDLFDFYIGDEVFIIGGGIGVLFLYELLK